MTFQELCNAVMLKATGKATILTPENAKWQKILGTANYCQNAWMNEPGQKWNSLYDRAHNIGVVSNTDTYALGDNVDELSTACGDDVYIKTKDGIKIACQLVGHDDLKNIRSAYAGGDYCAKVGRDLVFSRVFNEENQEFGGTIYAPVYLKVKPLVNGDDEIVVDDPYWLVTICAAEYIRNDIVKQNQYGNLMAEANNLMSNMIQKNRSAAVRKVRGAWRAPGGLR